MLGIAKVLILVLTSTISNLDYSGNMYREPVIAVSAPKVLDIHVLIKRQYLVYYKRGPTEAHVKQLTCLALNVFWESRAEPVMGKLAVANVTLNRQVNSLYPKDVCGVVYQRSDSVCQFSWTCKSSLSKQTRFVTIRRNLAEYNALISAVNVSVYAYKTRHDITDGALYFHSTSVKPDWSRHRKIKKTRSGYTEGGRIGKHIFYVRN